jgi:hypothetical protein
MLNRREALSVIGLGLTSASFFSVKELKAKENKIVMPDDFVFQTGLPKLDANLGGFADSNPIGIVTICGESGSGKSVLSRTMALELSKQSSVAMICEKPNLFVKKDCPVFRKLENNNLTVYDGSGKRFSMPDVQRLLENNKVVIWETFYEDLMGETLENLFVGYVKSNITKTKALTNDISVLHKTCYDNNSLLIINTQTRQGLTTGSLSAFTINHSLRYSSSLIINMLKEENCYNALMLKNRWGQCQGSKLYLNPQTFLRTFIEYEQLNDLAGKDIRVARHMEFSGIPHNHEWKDVTKEFRRK